MARDESVFGAMALAHVAVASAAVLITPAKGVGAPPRLAAHLALHLSYGRRRRREEGRRRRREEEAHWWWWWRLGLSSWAQRLI